MEKIITKQFIAYESGFKDGKSDVIEQLVLEDEPPVMELFDEEGWYSKGYEDGFHYYLQEYSEKGYIDEQSISTAFTDKIISEKYAERVVSYNQEEGKQVPVGKFRL